MYHGVITPPADPTSQNRIECDYLVVGAGVAGLRAAIELSAAGRVIVVAKDSLRESSSEYAQGGIAAALSDDDDIELHEQDTIAAGAGLCYTKAVHALVEEAPRAIQELIDWGAEFDREGSKLLFAREGAHSRSRVLHAHGDSTGSEIARTLYRKAASLPSVEFHSYSAITDLLVADGVVTGATACDRQAHCHIDIFAKSVLLATGGLGRVFQDTTNPDVATGDGVAVAYRAGAVVSDIEFVQFHPTALFKPGAPRFLLSEALRGEGAYLRNKDGERFMTRYSELGELAPRDVVSRSIVSEMRRTGSTNVFLDLTHLDPEWLPKRFPRIFETCQRLGVDLRTTPAPVSPAAHYAMGGVRTDLHGLSSLPGLYAAGEVACTGVHGANRLASNSLLEGLVFGKRAGIAIRDADLPSLRKAHRLAQQFPVTTEQEVRRIASQYCGILRDQAGLEAAIEQLKACAQASSTRPERADFELRSLHTVALLVAECALARKESRGGHYRTDFTEPRPEFQKHSLIRIGDAVRFS